MALRGYYNLATDTAWPVRGRGWSVGSVKSIFQLADRAMNSRSQMRFRRWYNILTEQCSLSLWVNATANTEEMQLDDHGQRQRDNVARSQAENNYSIHS